MFSFATKVAIENTEPIFNISLHWGVLSRHEVTESELLRPKEAQWEETCFPMRASSHKITKIEHLFLIEWTEASNHFQDLDKNNFDFNFLISLYGITLTLRGSHFSSLRPISLFIKTHHEKENNILRAKACGRHVFFFYVLYHEKARISLRFRS